MSEIETIRKTEAAQRAGVSTKKLERLVAQGKLTAYKRPGKTGLETHFAVADIDALKDESAALVVAPRAETDKPRQDRPQLDQLATLLQMLTQRALPGEASQDKTRHIAVAVESKVFLTMPEAVALSGLGLSHLEQAVKAGKLKVRTLPGVRGRRIRRSDLDAYLKKL